MTELMSGALAMGYLTAALFFVLFWRDARDRLFALFAASFVLLALQRILLTVGPPEWANGLYVVRLAAFLLIIAAIIDKNRR
jgi:hypothetical protein